MNIALALLWLAMLASALSAGLFYAFQWLVMPGLNAAQPLVAVDAMKAINAAVRNAFFAFAFFGPVVLGGIAALLFLVSWRSGWLLVVAGFLIYTLGVFGVTVAFNVPLNEQLARISPTATTAADAWPAFFEPWMLWNLVRTIASIVALLLFAAALWSDRTGTWRGGT